MYKSKLNLIDTQIGIKYIKDTFEETLAKKLSLVRVSAPMFVFKESGLNDSLNSVEEPVSFTFDNKNVEIVHSLAKWKRYALGKYNFSTYQGLYTDMNAIRKDETPDRIHSIYVDQWDWEKIIAEKDRTIAYLKKTVRCIYQALLQTEKKINKKYPQLKNKLAPTITFISSSNLLKMYPHLDAKQREYEACKKYGSIFIYQIGYRLKDKKPHDSRACDYDDWKLNGDLLVFDEMINQALELSSMGIRVNKESLVKQTKYKKETYKLETPYAKAILDDSLPLTIGGGIGQSRICMFFLEKIHIGEVQSSLWDEKNIEECNEQGINLL